jgi:hypothetical protein
MPGLQAPFAVFGGGRFGLDPLPAWRWTGAASGPSIGGLGLEGQRMSGLTTHILDQAVGRPAAGVLVRVSRRDGDLLSPVAEFRTDEDGRARLIAREDLVVGGYRLEFSIGDISRPRARR